MAHIMDLYYINASSQATADVAEHNADLLRQFIGLLYAKEYLKSHSSRHYTSQLFITPHYHTEVCKKISGKPATY